MRPFLLAMACCALGACTTPTTTTFNETSYGINRAPNSAPRGSDEFCRIYSQQTAADRIENSRNGRGGGPNGFGIFLGQQEGERAYRRCRAGRTN